MAGGSIDYAIGLATRGFIGPLLSANIAVGAFTALIGGLGAVGAGAFAQIDKGGKLADLSARLGQPIGIIASLQEAFAAVGVDGASAISGIARLQKGLSGLSDSGESTEAAFRSIGLTLKDLQGRNPIDQIQKVAGGLSKLGPEDAQAVADKLFGRGQGGDILQAARNMADFNERLADAAPLAAIFEKHGRAFDAVGDTIGKIDLHMRTFLAAVATGLAPALQTVLDLVKEIDGVKLGENLGRGIAGIGQAFKEGQIGKVLELTFQSAIQSASNLMLDQISLWGSAFRDALIGATDGADPGNGGGFWANLGNGALGVGAGLLGIWDQVGANLGIDGAEELATKRIEQAEALFNKAGIGDGIISRMASRRGTTNAANPFADELSKLINGLGQKAIAENLAKAGEPNGGNNKKEKETAFGGSSEPADALTRIGFFSGDSNLGLQYQRRIADGVQKLVELQREDSRRQGADFRNQ